MLPSAGIVVSVCLMRIDGSLSRGLAPVATASRAKDSEKNSIVERVRGDERGDCEEKVFCELIALREIGGLPCFYMSACPLRDADPATEMCGIKAFSGLL